MTKEMIDQMLAEKTESDRKELAAKINARRVARKKKKDRCETIIAGAFVWMIYIAFAIVLSYISYTKILVNLHGQYLGCALFVSAIAVTTVGYFLTEGTVRAIYTLHKIKNQRRVK